jgi:membrane-associated protein
MVSDVVDVLADLPGPLLLAVVGLAALLETAVLAGLVRPAELIVLLGASLAASGGTSPVLVAVAGGGAIAGDHVGYALGRRLGGRLRRGRLGRLVGERRWQGAEELLGRSGGRAVVAARFVGLVRPLAPPLAGITGFPYRRFAAASAVGAVAWTVLLVTLGTVAGSSARAVGDAVGRVGWAVVALGVPVATVVALRRRRRQRRLVLSVAA